MSNPKLNLLVAYPYMKPDLITALKDNQEDIRFLLDSGAFTAWKSGKEINVDDYCKFIESLPFKPWRYFTLDVIGNPEASLKNYEIMLSRGFKPVPIFTRGEDISMIDKYYETSDVVGIGGLVRTKGNKGFVKGIMNKVGARKVHWLGFTSSDFVNYYKPYMCDCSSWSYSTRFGDMQLYMGQGKIKSVHRRTFVSRPEPDVFKAIASYGIDPNLFSKEESWRSPNNLVHKVVAQSWVRRSLESEKILKTKLFLAAASIADINVIHDAYKKELS